MTDADKAVGELIPRPTVANSVADDSLPRPMAAARSESKINPSESEINPWWRIADVGALGLWTLLVGIGIGYHEKWADEAQAWLLARDLDLGTIWFRELRYEGSPGLWHTILWVAQHVFHLRYGALSYIGAFFALAGVLMLLFASPFPRPIRWLMVFSYFFVYQYAVIARPYVLFAVFALIAARQFRNLRRPDLFALSLVPLAALTAHGSLLSLGLALVYAFRFLKDWSVHGRTAQRRFVISAAGIALLYVFLFIVLRPAADVEATHQPGLTLAVIAKRSLAGVVGALVDNTWLSMAVFGIFGVWCFLRRALATFALPVVLIAGLCGYANSGPYQQGTIFLAMMAGLAIAWPDTAPGAEEEKRGGKPGSWSYKLMLAALAATLCYQIFCAAVAIRNEVLLPYSGAEDMAKYLAPLVKHGEVICGYQYGMVAINAYFDHNIFSNLDRAYYHHSTSEYNPQQVVDQLRSRKADYIVIQYFDPFDERLFQEEELVMARWGYPLVHFSDGYWLTKTGYSRCQIYMLFKKQLP